MKINRFISSVRDVILQFIFGTLVISQCINAQTSNHYTKLYNLSGETLISAQKMVYDESDFVAPEINLQFCNPASPLPKKILGIIQFKHKLKNPRKFMLEALSMPEKPQYKLEKFNLSEDIYIPRPGTGEFFDYDVEHKLMELGDNWGNGNQEFIIEPNKRYSFHILLSLIPEAGPAGVDGCNVAYFTRYFDFKRPKH